MEGKSTKIRKLPFPCNLVWRPHIFIFFRLQKGMYKMYKKPNLQPHFLLTTSVWYLVDDQAHSQWAIISKRSRKNIMLHV